MAARRGSATGTRRASGTYKSPLRKTSQEMIAEEIKLLKSQIALEISQRNSGFSGGLNISLGDIQEEYVTELQPLRQRTRLFERMANDPHVRGQLRGIAMTLISGVRWKTEGGTAEQRDLLGANILRDGSPKYWCSTSFYDRLYESLGMMIYGFSLFGKTRQIVDGDTMIFKHLKWLHPRSVDENGWIMDGADNLIEVRRTFHDATGMQFSRLPIAAEDLFLMCWDRRGPNWEGNSFIRPMYKPWKFAELAEKIDIIDLQNRGIAIPVAHLSGAGGPKERDTLQEILRSMRGANKDRAFIVLEKDEKIDFLTSTGKPKSAQEPIDRNHMGIAKAGGTEYSEVSSSTGGGRAAASVLATGFFINVDAIRILVEDMINFGVGPLKGLSEELQDMNFDTEASGFEYARIVGSRVSPTEQFDNIPLIQDSVKAGLIPPSLKYANETARRLGWPELTEAEFEKGMQLMGKGQQPMGAPGKAGADSNPSRGDKLSNTAPEQVPNVPVAASEATEPSAVARRSLQLAGTKGGEPLTGRAPTPEENHVLALAEIDNTLKSAEAGYAAILHRGQRREIDNIVQQVKDGLTVADLMKENAAGTLFKYRNQIGNDLKNKLTMVRNFGMGQVREELRRSKRKAAIEAMNPNHDEKGQFASGPGGQEASPSSDARAHYSSLLEQRSNLRRQLEGEAKEPGKAHDEAIAKMQVVEREIKKYREEHKASEDVTDVAISAANPYHDEKGQFASGPGTKEYWMSANPTKDEWNQAHQDIHRRVDELQNRIRVRRGVLDSGQAKTELAEMNRRLQIIHDHGARPEYEGADYKGWQSGAGSKPGFHIYDLKHDIPGHPTGSTVSENTLQKAGLKPKGGS